MMTMMVLTGNNQCDDDDYDGVNRYNQCDDDDYDGVNR